MGEHQPDRMFGCVEAWGPQVDTTGTGLFGSDDRRHICNQETDHKGSHRCKCGARRG